MSHNMPCLTADKRSFQRIFENLPKNYPYSPTLWDDPWLHLEEEHFAPLKRGPLFWDKGSRFVLLCDARVYKKWGQSLYQKLLHHTKDPLYFLIPEGEDAKTAAVKAAIESFLIENDCLRETVLVALGGGATLDLVGFVAATYCRGIGYLSIPSTLLAMVDASIGGKTAINIGMIKNRIGALHIPRAVWWIPPLLTTLSEDELRNGYAEIIKYGLIAQPALLLLAEQEEKLLTIIESCIAIKQELVLTDLHDRAARQLLNFGHTIGHAIEAIAIEEKIPCAHGKAVAIGMILELWISHFTLGFSKKHIKAVFLLLERFGFPLKLPGPFSQERLWEKSRLDKKNTTPAPHAIMLEALGRPYCPSGQLAHPITPEVWSQAWSSYRKQSQESQPLLGSPASFLAIPNADENLGMKKNFV